MSKVVQTNKTHAYMHNFPAVPSSVALALTT